MNAALITKAKAQLRQRADALAIAGNEVRRISALQSAMEVEQASDRAEAELFAEAIAGLNLIMEQTVTRNLTHLTGDVNAALKAIIPDQDLRFEVIPDVKWNKQVYSFAVYHDGVPHTDAEGIGGTVLAVVSLVLRLMFILKTRRYKLLVLDESLRFISKSHKARASRFVQQLAREFGVHVLLVTHDAALAVDADQTYMVRAPAKGSERDGSSIQPISREEVIAYFSSGAGDARGDD